MKSTLTYVSSVLFLFGLASCGSKEEEQVMPPKASKSVRVETPREYSIPPERNMQETLEVRFRLNAKIAPEKQETNN